MPRNCFFILTCARSGSTSLARILDSAANARCLVEPTPDLLVESRKAHERRLRDPEEALREKILPRVDRHLEEVEVYGEKHVTYGPFVEALHELLGCKFVLLTRDGRDVVRSLINWHEGLFGNIYRECRQAGDLTPTALSAAAGLPAHQDTSDYSRLRPLPEDPLHLEWERLSRSEMCAFYWSRMNDLFLKGLGRLPDNSSIWLDYTDPTADDVLRVAEFLGLEKLERAGVRRLLAKKINSLPNRGRTPDRAPRWTDWSSGLRDRFSRIAGATMRRLGYFSGTASDWRPPDFGRFWREKTANLPWYTWMYDSRRRVHEQLIDWVRKQPAKESRSIADFGCGLGVGYSDAFSERRYVGLDLSERNVEWCRRNRTIENHEYRCVDFIADPPEDGFDLVFSSGTIDNAYDIDAFLRSMVHASRGWIYLTCYRGWFPDLEEHEYRYDAEHCCFYNNVSPRRLRRVLEEEGCTEIEIGPCPTDNREIRDETRVIARVGSRR